MIRPLLGMLLILAIILGAETLWRLKVVRAEWSRKIVHMGVGTFVAFWPFFTSFRAVQLLSVAFCLVIVVSRSLHIFKGIHSVKRRTWGELFYPLGIGLASLLTNNKYIFAAAILHLSLADGLAAIIGLKYGRKNRYHIEKLTKSYAGTLTFAVTSLVITVWLLLAAASVTTGLPSGLHLATAWPLLIMLPLITAFVENIAPFGSDNVFIPLTVIAVLGVFPLLT